MDRGRVQTFDPQPNLRSPDPFSLHPSAATDLQERNAEGPANGPKRSGSAFSLPSGQSSRLQCSVLGDPLACVSVRARVGVEGASHYYAALYEARAWDIAVRYRLG